jgi:DNA-binding GntR family transcriptional regulator
MKNVVPGEVLKEIFPRKLRKRDLTSQVYNKLKKMILSGKLKKGEHLIQEELALRFNVSRQTVIFALRQLKKDKLIVVKYKRGSFVSWNKIEESKYRQNLNAGKCQKQETST